MTLLLIISIAIIAVIIYTAIRSQTKDTDQQRLLDLNTTTLAERQQYYKRGYRLQMQYDELQRLAEASGDTATLEAILLNTYTGPLPELDDKKLTPKIVLDGGDSNAPVQELQYFCIKDKGYHTSVWPKVQGIQGIDYLEFSIAGITHGEHVNEHLGEFIAALVADPANPYDSNAIKIITREGHRVGYVPRDYTSAIRNFATLPCTCYCYIGINNNTYYTDCYIIKM